MIAVGVVLVALWVALWGELSVANVVSGAIVVATLTLLFPSVHGTATGHRVHPWALVVLVTRLLFDLVVSSWAVARAVVRPRPGSRDTAVVAVPLATRSPVVATIVANAITLTPGTMSLGCSEQTFVLEVHVLGRRDHDEFVETIRALERRVIAAVTPVGGGAS